MSNGRCVTTGFTLIELMITVAIVAILAAVAYPSYIEHVRKSRRAQAKADLVELAQLAERFHTANGTFANFSLSGSGGFTQSPKEGGLRATCFPLPLHRAPPPFLLSPRRRAIKPRTSAVRSPSIRQGRSRLAEEVLLTVGERLTQILKKNACQ